MASTWRISRAHESFDTSALGILLEHRQLRQRIVAHQELIQRCRSRFVQRLGQQTTQTSAFSGQCLADEFLQSSIAGTDNFVHVEPDDQLGGDEPGGHIAANDLRRLLRELRQDVSCPWLIAEQLSNSLARV